MARRKPYVPDRHFVHQVMSADTWRPTEELVFVPPPPGATEPELPWCLYEDLTVVAGFPIGPTWNFFRVWFSKCGPTKAVWAEVPRCGRVLAVSYPTAQKICRLAALLWHGGISIVSEAALLDGAAAALRAWKRTS